jgi:hypothetical protein
MIAISFHHLKASSMIWQISAAQISGYADLAPFECRSPKGAA